jgi:hypothetical protein
MECGRSANSRPPARAASTTETRPRAGKTRTPFPWFVRDDPEVHKIPAVVGLAPPGGRPGNLKKAFLKRHGGNILPD